DTSHGAYPQTVTIARGSSVRAATAELGRRHIVRSARLLELYLTVTSGGTGVAGGYLFQEAEPPAPVARRLARGRHGESEARVAFPEGSTVRDMAGTLDAALPQFDPETFLDLASGREGFLFPETYFFFPSVTEAEVVQRIERAFDDALEP